MAKAADSNAKTVSLSLRLLKEGTTPTKALRKGHGMQKASSTSGTQAYVKQIWDNVPDWTEFLSKFVPSAVELRSASSSALLFIKAGPVNAKRLFVLCFGQGHHALDEDAIERRFGLKVVLNCVAKDHLRTLDTANLDTTVLQRRAQTSRDSDLSVFDLDIDRDLLRLASGTPSGPFAKAVSGKDALTLRAQIDPGSLASRCADALKLFHANDYKTDFGFIDQFMPVEDKVLLEELDRKLFADLDALVRGGASDLHLAIPDILAPEDSYEIGYFGQGLPSGTKPGFAELAIEDYVAELLRGNFSSIKDMATLKSSHEIQVVKEGQGDRSRKRKLYRCFVSETVLRKHRYVLFDGQWYLIEKSFYTQVETFYQNLVKPSFLLATDRLTERDLIDVLKADPRLLCMDQTRSGPRGAEDAQLEACDFLSKDRRIIHLKDGHGSAPLSHLWKQGLVSAESFAGDPDFRKSFRSQAAKREKEYKKTGFASLLPDGRTKLIPGDYPIIFGVMRHPNAATKDLGLPFFSKVAVRATAQRISRMGFPVELHLIEKTRRKAKI
jgi:uncharacterized protein (TIGR04141 family)